MDTCTRCHDRILHPVFRRCQGGRLARCLRGSRDTKVRPCHRLGPILLSNKTDLFCSSVLWQAARQFRPGHFAADLVRQAGLLSARQQILQRDEQDEALAARDTEVARALSRRQGPSAAGDDGSLQARRGESDGGLPADRDPDPGLLLALQGAVRHDRDATCAVLRLDPRSFGAGPDLSWQPVRSAAGLAPGDTGCRRCGLSVRDRHLAADHGCDDVPAAKAQSAAGRPGPGADVHVAADRLHLHAGSLPGRPRHLLGVEQFAQHSPAMGDHASPGCRLTPTAEISTEIFPPRMVDPDLAEAGRRLFARDARFVAGASEASTLPGDALPEIAFAGRSNVGKSSLLNALTGRRTLARISNTPGRTRQINFFDLGGRVMLVDLPGYGYAEASKTEARRWTALLRGYLRTRTTLRRVCLLIDSRHGIKEIDRLLMRMLDDSGVSFQVVLTKTDKAGAGELARVAELTVAELAAHAAAHPEIHLTSAVKRHGIAALRTTLGSLALADRPPSAVVLPAPAQ